MNENEKEKATWQDLVMKNHLQMLAFEYWKWDSYYEWKKSLLEVLREVIRECINFPFESISYIHQRLWFTDYQLIIRWKFNECSFLLTLAKNSFKKNSNLILIILHMHLGSSLKPFISWIRTINYIKQSSLFIGYFLYSSNIEFLSIWCIRITW